MRLQRIDRCLENAGGIWFMLTLTLRHRRGMSLRVLLRGLAKAFRRMRQGGQVQLEWTARVSASIRATEITHGQHGWHPHIHVILRSEEWPAELQAEVAKRWQRAVEQVLGADCVPDVEHGVDFGQCFDAGHADERKRGRYLTKLGCEIAGIEKKARNENESMWQVAERAAGGCAEAIQLWRELVEATKGRRMIEMDDRAVAFARMPRHVSDDAAAEDRSQVREVFLWQEDLHALATLERTLHRGALASVLVALSKAIDPERELAGIVKAAARAWWAARRASEAA